MRSRKQEDVRRELRTAGGDDVVVEPTSHPVGTTIEIRLLPQHARKAPFFADKTEQRHVEETLKRMAMSRFDVHFTLKTAAKRIRLPNSHFSRTASTAFEPAVRR